MAARPSSVSHASARYRWAVALALLAYFVLMVGFDRSLFAPRPGRVLEEPDGFEMTILSVLAGEETPLWLWARFLVIGPLLALNQLLPSPVPQALYLLVYALPVVLWSPPGAPRRALQLLLLFLPVAVSFRLAISIWSVCYCLIFIVDGRVSAWTFLWFALAVFLSSSTMFIFLVYFPLLAVRRLRRLSMTTKVIAWVLYLTVLNQFFEKAWALLQRSLDGELLSTSAKVGIDYSGSTGGFLFDMFSGNPFFMSIVDGQYDRLLLLTLSMVVALSLVAKLSRKGDSAVLYFVLILMTSMLSEGVGAYSVGVVLAMVAIHHRWFLGHRRRMRQIALQRQARGRERQAEAAVALPGGAA